LDGKTESLAGGAATRPLPVSRRGEFDGGWPVLLAGVLGVACGASPVPFNVIGFLFAPLDAEFGWGRAEVSIGITIFGVVAALLAPLYGWMADRYGVRRVALLSLAAFGLSFAAFYLTPPSLSGFYAMWLLLGLVGIGSTPVTWSRAINMWFFRHRGLALGILLLGTSLAAIVVPKLAVWAIEGYGWRQMFIVVAGLPLLVALPVGLLLFREPRPEERPAAIASTTGRLTGISLGAALRDRRFWLIWLSILLIAFAYGGAHIHMPSIVGDHGFAPADAASIMGIVGIGILSGRIITGLLLDRFWAGAVAFPLLCMPAIACFMLMGQTPNLPIVSVAAFMLGFAAGAESDLIAYLAGRYFGMAHYGRIYGMLYMPFGLFSAVSPAVYGRVRDSTGSYDAMLTAAAAMFVAGGALLLLLGRYPATLPEAAE
jgi:MFS family permease